MTRRYCEGADDLVVHRRNDGRHIADRFPIWYCTLCPLFWAGTERAQRTLRSRHDVRPLSPAVLKHLRFEANPVVEAFKWLVVNEP
jgi:hypothetical protein